MKNVILIGRDPQTLTKWEQYVIHSFCGFDSDGFTAKRTDDLSFGPESPAFIHDDIWLVIPRLEDVPIPQKIKDDIGDRAKIAFRLVKHLHGHDDIVVCGYAGDRGYTLHPLDLDFV